MKNIYCDIKLKIQNGSERGIGPGIILLLEYIHETHSVVSASKKMNMSVSKAWKIIKSTEKHSSVPILSSKTGGASGGCTTLSDDGKKLISTYRKMEAECLKYSDELLKKYYNEFIVF